MCSCRGKLRTSPPGMVTVDGSAGTEEVGTLVPNFLLLLHRDGNLLDHVCIQELWKTSVGKVGDGINRKAGVALVWKIA